MLTLEEKRQIFDQKIQEINTIENKNIGERFKFTGTSNEDFIKALLKHAQSMIALHKNRENDTRDYHIELLTKNTIGGTSFIEQGIGFIGIYIGTPFILRAMFERILADPETLTHIGDISLEKKCTTCIPKLPEQIEEPLKWERPYRYPNCQIRLNYAWILLDSAFLYIAAHEMAHLSNGHHEWINELKMNKKERSDPYDIPKKPTSSLTWQTLEMDADCGAVRRCTNDFLMTEQVKKSFFNNLHGAQLAANKHAFNDEDSSIFHFLFAIHTLFRIYDKNVWLIEGLQQRYYPPAQIRESWISNVIAEHMKLHSQKKPEQDLHIHVGNINAKAAIEAITSCSRLLGTEPILDGIRGACHESSHAHLRTLLKHWSKIRPYLEPYNTGGKLAPEQNLD